MPVYFQKAPSTVINTYVDTIKPMEVFMNNIKNKVLSNFRLHPEDLAQLKESADKLQLSKTQIVERALHRFWYDLSQGKPA